MPSRPWRLFLDLNYTNFFLAVTLGLIRNISWGYMLWPAFKCRPQAQVLKSCLKRREMHVKLGLWSTIQYKSDDSGIHAY